MCRGCGVRHNSVALDGIPGPGQNVRQAQLSPLELGLQSPKFEPIRGYAMKEFEEQTAMLKKDNFALKLRIYFLEDLMGKKDFNPESKADIYNALELKAEAEALKGELHTKEELLSQASEALSGLEQQFQTQLDQNNREKHQLKEQIQELQNEVEEFWSNSTQDLRSVSGEPELMNLCHSDSIGGLSDLCSLAFNTTSEDSQPEYERDNAPFLLPNILQESTTINAFNNPAPLKGLFSMVEGPEIKHDHSLLQHQVTGEEEDLSGKDDIRAVTMRVLESKVAMLENQVLNLEEELAGKEDHSFIIEGELANLSQEFEEKTEEVVSLQVEILDKNIKMETTEKELQASNKIIEENELQIQKLCEDLYDVEPEREVTIQRIVERDRIIEGKIEQIESQNKIIVEIQITLDEKQKQMSELESILMNTQQQLASTEYQLENQTKDNMSVTSELEVKENEVSALKNNLAKQEHNIVRLVGELKESMDMLNKVQWEAQNCTADDSITDMAQEENERLWAEMEQTKTDMAKLKTDHEHSLAAAQNVINELQKSLQEQCNKLHAVKEEQEIEIKECEESLAQKTKELTHLESEILQLINNISERDLELQNNMNCTTSLKEQLFEAGCEIEKLKNEIKYITKHTLGTEKMLPVVDKEHIDVCNHTIGDLTNYYSVPSNEMEKMKEIRNPFDKLKNEISFITKHTLGTEKMLPISYITKRTLGTEKMLPVIEEEPIDVCNHTIGGLTNDFNVPSNEIEKKYEIRNPFEIRETALLLNEDSNNTSVLPNGTSFLTIDSSHVSVNSPTNNSDLFTCLFKEVKEIRKDAQMIRTERISLTEKVLDLKNQMKQHFNVNNEIRYHESENKVNDEISEESRHKLNEINSSTNSHLTRLSQVLQYVKQRIECQFKEVHIHSNQEIVATYQEENLALREQLTVSNVKCELLRSNLEEMSTRLQEVGAQEEIILLRKQLTTSNVECELLRPSIEFDSMEVDSPATSIDTSDFIILTPLLKDIKSLCKKLEEATTKNNILKEHLQKAMMSNYDKKQAKVDEFIQTKGQLEECKALLVETTAQAELLQQQCQVHLSHTKAMESELNETYTTINVQMEEMKVKEILLQKANQCLEEKETLLHETSIQITANNEIIQGLSDEIEYLQKVACKNSDLEEQVSVLQYALQTCESRLLQANKERLVQVTENKRQQAQIAAYSLQIKAFEEEQSTSKEILNKNLLLTKQLEDEKSKTSNLLQEKDNLISSKILLKDENMILSKKLEDEKLKTTNLLQEKENLISSKILLEDENVMLTKKLEDENSKISKLLKEKEDLIARNNFLEDKISCGKQTLEENAVLVKQLENERESMELIQQEKKYLISDKLKLHKDMQKIQNELMNIDDCAYHIQAQHSNNLQQYHIQQHNYQLLREKHVSLQQTHSELKIKADQLENEMISQRKQQKQLEMNQQQIDNFEAHIIQLSTQVETERLLTSNLRKQLETIRSKTQEALSQHSTSDISGNTQKISTSNISGSTQKISSSDIRANNQKASCLTQKGNKDKKRKVHWSDENNCNQREVNDCCTENTEYTLARHTESSHIEINDNQPETGARSKLSLNEHEKKHSLDTSLSTISSCSSSVWKKTKRTPFPTFISNGQYG